MASIDLSALRLKSIAFERRKAYFAWVFAAAILITAAVGISPGQSSTPEPANYEVAGVGVFLAAFGMVLFVYPGRRMPAARLVILPDRLQLELVGGLIESVSFLPPVQGEALTNALVGLADRSGLKRSRPEDWFTVWYVDAHGRLRAVPLDRVSYEQVLTAWRASGGHMTEEVVGTPGRGGTIRGFRVIR